MLRFRPGSSWGAREGRAASQQRPGCTRHLGAGPSNPYQSHKRAPRDSWPPRDGWRGHCPQKHLITLRAAQYRWVARGRPTQVSRRQVGTRLQVRARG